MTEYIPEVVVVYSTLSFDPFNQPPQSQSEYYVVNFTASLVG